MLVALWGTHRPASGVEWSEHASSMMADCMASVDMPDHCCGYVKCFTK